MENKLQYSGTINYELSILHQNQTLFLHLKSTQNYETIHYKMEYDDESLPYELKKQSIDTEETYKLLMDKKNFDIDLLRGHIIINLKMIVVVESDLQINKVAILELSRQQNRRSIAMADSVFLEFSEYEKNFAEFKIEEQSDWSEKFDQFRKEVQKVEKQFLERRKNFHKEINYYCDAAYGRYKGQLQEGLPQGFGTICWNENKRYEGEWKDGLFDGIGILHSIRENKGIPFVMKSEYKGGQLSGRAILKDENGLSLEGQFKDNVANGLWRAYNSDGNYIQKELLELLAEM